MDVLRGCRRFIPRRSISPSQSDRVDSSIPRCLSLYFQHPMYHFYLFIDIIQLFPYTCTLGKDKYCFQLLRAIRKNIFDARNKIKILFESIMENVENDTTILQNYTSLSVVAVATVAGLYAASQKIFHAVSGTSLRDVIFLRLSIARYPFCFCIVPSLHSHLN